MLPQQAALLVPGIGYFRVWLMAVDFPFGAVNQVIG
jgi:hypothetical protein